MALSMSALTDTHTGTGVCGVPGLGPERLDVPWAWGGHCSEFTGLRRVGEPRAGLPSSSPPSSHSLALSTAARPPWGCSLRSYLRPARAAITRRGWVSFQESCLISSIKTVCGANAASASASLPDTTALGCATWVAGPHTEGVCTGGGSPTGRCPGQTHGEPTSHLSCWLFLCPAY